MEGDNVYRKTEIVGSSRTSVSDAIETAIKRATKTVRNVEWFEVTDVRGHVRDGKIEYYQVSMKLGFRVEE